MGNLARSPHIFVIDDSQAILDLMRELLEAAGYQISVFREAPALPMVKDLAPQLIVQEVLGDGLPKRTWEFLTLAQLDREVAGIPLILCTPAVDLVHHPVMAANLDRLGIRVLLKPCTGADLVTAVAETLTAQRLLEQVWGA